MKKNFITRIFFLSFMALFFNKANAQTDINISFSDRMNYIFNQLDKSKVPNGLLSDYAMEFTKLSNFDGALLTDSEVTPTEFWDVYNTPASRSVPKDHFDLKMKPRTVSGQKFGA